MSVAVAEQPAAQVHDATSWLRSSDGALVAGHDVVLLDLDGVVYVGPDAVDGAVETLRELRRRSVRVAFVTNNAARTPEEVAHHLTELDVDARPDDVVTSAQAAARLLAEELDDGDRVLVIGAEGLRRAVQDAGLVPVESMSDDPQAVVQGFSPQLSWPMLAEACVAVRAGLLWVATNLDSTLPTPRGPAPGNGAFVEVVARTTGVRPRVAGKPARALLDAAVDRTGAQNALFVGDRLDTDLAGARASDLAGVHVLTGSSAVADLLAAGTDRRPTYLAADLRGLLDEHRAPVRSGQSWCSGGSTAVEAGWRDGVFVVEAGPGGGAGSSDADPRVALDVLRVACAATWAAVDEGREVDLGQVREAIATWTAPQGWDR